MKNKRHNWKQDVADAINGRAERRNKLLVRKEEVSEQLSMLTIEEIRSDKYEQLKAEQRELVAMLATL